MQLIPRYLVNNRTTVVVNDAGFATEYRPVYTNQIQLYRGIDNKLEFKLVNADQKGKALTGYTAKFLAFDENDDLVLDKVGTASTTVTGLFTVTVTESDLLDIKDQFLSYNIYLQDSNGQKTLTYSSSHFGNAGTAKVSSEAFPGAKDSHEITTFTESADDVWTTVAIDAQPERNGNNALHTIAVYSANYEGTLEIEASLEEQITPSMGWHKIDTVVLDNETHPVDKSFNGVYSYLRFRTTTDPTNKISKILVRN